MKLGAIHCVLGLPPYLFPSNFLLLFRSLIQSFMSFKETKKVYFGFLLFFCFFLIFPINMCTPQFPFLNDLGSDIAVKVRKYLMMLNNE